MKDIRIDISIPDRVDEHEIKRQCVLEVYEILEKHGVFMESRVADRHPPEDVQ